MLCSNCDGFPAIFHCLQCPQGNHLYCGECKEVHVKIKQFKNHVLKPLTVHKCSNCEQSVAKFICKQCSDDSKYLCLGCSVFHVKVKLYRGHELIPVAGNSHKVIADGIVIRLLSSPYIEKLKEMLIQNGNSFTATILVVLVCSIAFFLSRMIFGSASLIINIMIITLVYVGCKYYLKHVLDTKDISLKDMSPAAKDTVKNYTRMNLAKFEEEFPDEFVYSSQAKKLSLRPRGMPFKGRPAVKSPTKEKGDKTQQKKKEIYYELSDVD